MTDQELSNRLRKLHLAVDCRIAADRIEELVKERDEALNQLDSTRHSVDVLEKRLTDKMAKLAKAMKFIGLSIELARFDLAPKLLDDMIYFKTEYELEKTG